MSKSQSPNFEEVPFQLEFNLQNIRRGLVHLVEENKVDGGRPCNCPNCRCPSQLSSSSSSSYASSTSTDSAYTNSYDHYSNIEIPSDHFYKAAPPPESLPTPRWPQSVTRKKAENVTPVKELLVPIKFLNAWVRASIPNVAQSSTSITFPVPMKVMNRANLYWPPMPPSIWSEEALKETIRREQMISNNSDTGVNNSVAEFFKLFSKNG